MVWTEYTSFVSSDDSNELTGYIKRGEFV